MFIYHFVSAFSSLCPFNKISGPCPDVYSQLIMSQIHRQVHLSMEPKDEFTLRGRVCFQSLTLWGT